MDDLELLREYADGGSQAAFVELVSRHIDLVYAACLRRLRHKQDAEDATQAVFILLSRKARSIPRGVVLAGWLYRAAAFVARDAVRASNVRRKHEMTAASQRTDRTSEQPAAESTDVDRALSRLRAGDRDAILLRYFQGHSFQEVGRQLRISEEAARKRVSRGLERLRQFLKPVGGPIPSAAMAETVLHGAVHCAPPGLAKATLGAVAAGPAAAGTAVSLAKGATILMALSKTKAVAIGALAVLLVGGGTVATIHVLHPSSDESVVIPQNPGPAGADVTTVGTNNWQQAFRQAYGLADGEVIKPVKPVPAREQFWEDQFVRKSGERDWKLSNNDVLTIEWNGKSFRWISMGSMGTVADAIRLCAGVKAYQIDPSVRKYTPEVRSDWVTRAGATTGQKMAALGRIASQQLGHELRFEKRRVMRDAIIVRGRLSTVPSVVTLTDGRGPRNLQPPAQQGTIADLLNTLEDRLGRKVVNETSDTKTRLTYRDLFPFDNHIPEVLERLSKETSLTFSIEPREVDVWFAVEGSSTTTAAK